MTYQAQRLPIAKIHGPQAAFDSDLASDIAGMTGLAQWWDFNPTRITAGTHQSIANRVGGGAALVEQTAFSNLSYDSSDLPYGGTVVQSGVFDSNTLLEATGFPTGATSIFTKVVIFKSSDNVKDDNILRHRLWAQSSITTNAHDLHFFGNDLVLRIGSTGSTIDVTSRYPQFEWCYVIASWNNVSKVGKLAVNRWATATATGASQLSNSSGTSRFGGTGSPVGRFKADTFMLFHSTTAADGDLFDATRAADLEKVRLYCEARIGLLQQVY